MKKKYLRIFSIIVGILFLIFLVGNIGLNLWLKHKLPDYVKNNSAYLVSYKTLDVHWGTGNIFSTGLTIKNKNPENQNVIGVEGSVDSVSVSRLGIFDWLYNKRINTADLTLQRPHLKIILAKPVDSRTGKKRNPLVLQNISIHDGNIQIFRHTKQKFVGVSDLNLNVQNLQLTEEAVKKKLPFVFDSYDISGKNFFYRPDNVYAVTAKHITTREGQMNIKNIALIPLLSFQNFRKYYPKKSNLFDFKAAEMSFKDIALKDNKVVLSHARFENPDLHIFTTNAKASGKKKPFTYDVNLEDVFFNNAKIKVLKTDGSPLFSTVNLTANINKFVMNEETATGRIPFQYADFKILGRNVHYVSENQDVKISALSLNPKSADFRNISMKPTVSVSTKTLSDITAKQLTLKFNEWGFIENKLKLNVQNILVDGLNGKIITAKNSARNKPRFEGIAFPLIIKNVNLKNSNLVLEREAQPLTLKDLNANIQNIEMNAQTVKEGIPFKTGFYSFTTRNFNYRTKFYNLSASLLKFSKNAAHISSFSMQPLVSRAQFIRMIPTEKDLYTIKVNQIDMVGSWDLFSAQKYLNATQVTCRGLDANIFRSKLPKDDLSEKPLYSKLLRSIKFPMFINNLEVKNSVLVYEEDTKKSDGPGKLLFDQLNLQAKNLNSGKMKGKPTQIPVSITCRFMNSSPMKVKWNLDTKNSGDAFSIAGNISALPASHINPFIEPYLNITATGLISDLIFNFKGNNNGIHGILNMKHENLKIAVLKKTGEKDKILSALANIFVKSDSGFYPESVAVENVGRDKTKSFFNLFWRGIELGLKKTLLGNNAPKTEKSIRNTVDNTKSALEENKKDMQETKTEVKEKVENVKEKGGFWKIFKKKSASN